MYRLIAHPVFGKLFTAQVIALIGTGLLTVALGLLAYDLAGPNAAAVLGVAYTIKMVAYVGLSPVASALFARANRRVVLISADAVRAAVALSLPFLTEVWQIYVAIFVLQAASATFTPAFQAIIPDVLDDEEDYTQALSLSRMAYDLESLISPALAGVLLTVISFHWLFVGTSLGFVLSAMFILPLALPTPAQSDRPFRDRLTRGVRIYLATPRLRGLLSVNLTAAASSAFVITNTVSLVRDHYAGTDQDVAFALAAYGAGSLMAALVLPMILRRMADRVVMVGGAVMITGLLTAHSLVATSLSWFGLLFVWAALGGCYATTLTPAGRLLRRSAQPEDRPSIFTAQFALSHLCWLITYPIAGFGMARFGPAPTLLTLASIAALGVLLARRFWPPHSSDPVPHSHPELPQDHPHLRDHGILHHAHSIVIDDTHRQWPHTPD